MGSFCDSSSELSSLDQTLFLVPLSQPHPEPPAVLLNELNPGRFKRGSDFLYRSPSPAQLTLG
jgi:hypothetical protein